MIASCTSCRYIPMRIPLGSPLFCRGSAIVWGSRTRSGPSWDIRASYSRIRSSRPLEARGDRGGRSALARSSPRRPTSTGVDRRRPASSSAADADHDRVVRDRDHPDRDDPGRVSRGVAISRVFWTERGGAYGGIASASRGNRHVDPPGIARSGVAGPPRGPPGGPLGRSRPWTGRGPGRALGEPWAGAGRVGRRGGAKAGGRG